MKTFNLTSYGHEYNIYFERTAYCYNDALAVMAYCSEPGEDFWEPYGVLTVNISEFSLGPNVAYLDTNNSAALCELVMSNGWAKQIGEGRSGWCAYPLVEFTDEFLRDICECAENDE